MNTVARFFIHVVLPTFVGAFVYIGWRSTDLLVFRWLEYCDLLAFVYRPTISLPEWVLYSLPDGCWVYATTSWMLLIWKDYNPWTWIAVILAVGAEFGQMFGIVQGTYQTLDVLFYIAGFVLAGVFCEKAYVVSIRDSDNGILGVG